MSYIIDLIVSYLSANDLLDIALKNKTPSELQKILKPYNNIIEKKCYYCEEVYVDLCAMCHRKVCTSCIEYKCEYCNNTTVCGDCINNDSLMDSYDMIRYVTCMCEKYN